MLAWVPKGPRFRPQLVTKFLNLCWIRLWSLWCILFIIDLQNTSSSEIPLVVGNCKCLFPPVFQPTKHSPSLRKASRSNPSPLFSNCMQNDFTSMSWCVVAWPVSAKNQLYTTRLVFEKTYCRQILHDTCLIIISKLSNRLKSFLFLQISSFFACFN